jgi:nucleoid-associated protein EbfC
MPDDIDPPAPLPDGPALPDLGGLLGMAMDLQQQVAAAQEEAAATVVEGQAGGGAVRVEVTGGFDFRKVTIDPEALDPNDVEMLQDLVLAALHDAVARVNDLQAGADPLAGLGELAGAGGLDLGALGLGDLAGVLGGAGPGAIGAGGVGAGHEPEEGGDGPPAP